jgi:hypothetical protein
MSAWPETGSISSCWRMTSAMYSNKRCKGNMHHKADCQNESNRAHHLMEVHMSMWQTTNAQHKLNVRILRLSDPLWQWTKCYFSSCKTGSDRGHERCQHHLHMLHSVFRKICSGGNITTVKPLSIISEGTTKIKRWMWENNSWGKVIYIGDVQGPRKWTVPVWKHCTWERWIEVSLYLIKEEPIHRQLNPYICSGTHTEPNSRNTVMVL